MGASQFGSDVVLRQPHTITSTAWIRCQVKSRRDADSRLRPRLIQSEPGRLAATQLILAMVRRQSSANTYFMIRFFAMPVFFNRASVPYF
jgi:hypothetical protein